MAKAELAKRRAGTAITSKFYLFLGLCCYSVIPSRVVDFQLLVGRAIIKSQRERANHIYRPRAQYLRRIRPKVQQNSNKSERF